MAPNYVNTQIYTTCRPDVCMHVTAHVLMNLIIVTNAHFIAGENFKSQSRGSIDRGNTE